mgnify:CR=1 FL=1
MKKNRFWFIPMIILMLPINVANASANANVPYHTYNYGYWDDIYYTPAAYVPSGNISGSKLEIGAFNSPQDIFVGKDGRVYVADTGNNRIVVLDSERKGLSRSSTMKVKKTHLILHPDFVLRRRMKFILQIRIT